MTITKMTPNLYTDDVAACAAFWVDRLQFTKTAEVPEGDNLALVALEKGAIELMYGSYNSLQQEGLGQRGPGYLFIEVDDLDAALAAMQGAPVLNEVHKTLYGATEFTVQDPAGHILTFAQFG